MRAAVCMLLFTLWPFSAVAETGHPAASAAVLVAGPVAATLTGPDQTAARNALAQYPDPPDTGTPEPEPPKPELPKPDIPTPGAPKPDSPKPGLTEVAPERAELSPVNVALVRRLGDKTFGLSADERTAAAAVYNQRAEPLWTAGKGLSPAGTAIVAELRRADDYGLPVQDIVTTDLLSALPSQLPSGDAGTSTLVLADTEIKITAAIFAYAKSARGGRIREPSKQLATLIDRAPQILKPADVMARVTTASDPAAALRGLNPQHPEFEALRRAYVDLRGKAQTAAASRLGSGPSLRPGDRHPHVAIARRIMAAGAPAPGQGAATVASAAVEPADLDVYDVDFANAVRAFQTSTGLMPADGIIGRKTRVAIDGLAGERGPSARELLVNMEQWRWMPDDLGATRVEVNIPEFTIRLIKNEKVVFSEPVVVGEVDKQTPLFSDRLQTIVLRPDWILPESVKVREAIPSLLGRGDFFKRYGLRVKRGQTNVEPRSVDWYSANQRIYTFYQPPGETNALGQVKFLFPNKHAVYFHDTPGKSLFDKRERTFSRGCIRVRNPVTLAALILGPDRGWTAQNVTDLVERGPDDNRVALGTPIPIHITYFTVVAGEGGKLKKLKDIYGHDKRISLALDGRWSDIDVPENHLAPIEDREFEWRVSSTIQPRRPSEAQRRTSQYQTNPVENFFQSLFGQ